MTSRILVVDDDTALAEMIGIVLRTEGFEPVFCADGAAAVDEWRAQRPDLVLLDLMLPGRDGVDVCRDLRAESDVPIVMLTANAMPEHIAAGRAAGADRHLAKPFNASELLAIVADPCAMLRQEVQAA